MTTTTEESEVVSEPKVGKTGTQLLQELYGNRFIAPGQAATSLGLSDSQKQARDEVGEKANAQSAPPPNSSTLVLDGVSVRLRSTPAGPQVHPDIKTSYQLLKPPPAEPMSPAAQLTSKRERIIETACGILKVRYDRVKSKVRVQEISRPRQVIIFFMLRYTNLSSTLVGRFFDFDHTTVLYARDKVQAVLDHGPRNELEKSLLEGLKKLCEYYEQELPSSDHWPKEKVPVQDSVQASAG